MMCHYQVRLKGINALPPDEPKQLKIGYDVSNHVWIKTPNGQYTSLYACCCVIGGISPQNVLVDRMPRHIRDFRSVMGSNTSENESNSELSTQSARTIINDAHSDSLEVGNPDAIGDTSIDESSEKELALPQRMQETSLGFYPYNHQIMGECNRIKRQNEHPATSGEPISLCHSKRQCVVGCICM